MIESENNYSPVNNIRPYSQSFNAWVDSKQQDKSRLLRGQALVDAQTWIEGKSFQLNNSPLWSVAFSPDDQIIAAAGRDVKLWKKDGTLLRILPLYSTNQLAVTFSPDGQIAPTDKFWLLGVWIIQ